MKSLYKSLIYNALIFITLQTTAQPCSRETALEKVSDFLHLSQNAEALLVTEPIQGSRGTLAWLITTPDGRFVVAGADSSLRPILAYGPEIQNLTTEQRSIWISFLALDYENRLKAIERGLLATQKGYWTGEVLGDFQQWPPEGSTATGGWLKTNWTQTSPYNKLCPMDLNAGSRSVVGCPATAMAQIFNYFYSVNGTRFNDSDDYYHNYGTGNKYWIDDDFQSRDFPSFPALNHWLDTIETSYTLGTALTDSMKAALSFAAGIAAQQVYTASVSGTFGIDQAQMAIQRFGFDLSELLVPPDLTLHQRVSQDMMNGFPDHLGIVNEAWTVGHNVVIDGYNTDDFFHFNFGWGGSSNGWYTLPPTNIPYDLTVIEGVVVNIRSSTAGLSQTHITLPQVIVSRSGRLLIKGLTPGQMLQLKVFTSSGALVFTTKSMVCEGQLTLQNDPLPAGLYLVQLIDAHQSITIKTIAVK